MFAQRIRQLGLTVAAAAVIATTFASSIPASAAPLGPSPDREYATPLPDVTISSLYFYPGNDVDEGHLSTVYVKNIGKATANAVAVKGECSDIDGKHTLAYGQVVGPITPDHDVMIQFYCPPASWGSRITVGTPNDANPKNNVAKSPNFW